MFSKFKILLSVSFMLFTFSLSAYELVTHVDKPQISLGIDKENEQPLKVTNKITEDTKSIYASTITYRAFAGEKLTVDWYYREHDVYNPLKHETFDVVGSEFVYSKLTPKNGKFELGEYQVVFTLGISKPKKATFKVLKRKSANIAQNNSVKHYNPSEFKTWSDIYKRKITLKDIYIKKLSWNKREKRISFVVQTDKKTFRDEHIYCRRKKSYYYCPIEDDGGYIKLDAKFNMYANVEFAKYVDDEPLVALGIRQKSKIKWSKPLMQKSQTTASCAGKDADYYLKIIKRMRKVYPEVTIKKLEKINPDLYYTKELGISFLAPKAWKRINGNDVILYMTQGKSVEKNIFTFFLLKKFWKNSNVKEPEKLLKKATRHIANGSYDDAKEHGDKLKIEIPAKMFEKGQYQIEHIVLKRTGKLNRFESWTLLWDGKNIYVFYITSDIKNLATSEFLSSIATMSFCSEGR